VLLVNRSIVLSWILKCLVRLVTLVVDAEADG